MRIFVAGATGVIGRRLVPMLAEAGHDVAAMTRSERKEDEIREMGAEPIVCDVFDAIKLRDAVMGAEPEVVVHELTDLPPALDPKRMDQLMAGNDRIRTEGTANLVAASLSAKARKVVAQSIAFAYAPGGFGLREEEDPLFTDAPPPWQRSVRAVQELERLVTRTAGIEGVVLRYGFFYGPGTSYASDGSTAALVRRRRFPVIGRGEGVFSFVHVDDAAAATVAAIERGWPGIYNVVDDDPAPLALWLPYYAEAIGARRPRRLPRWLAKRAAGRYVTMLATELQGASNARAKHELDWAPRYPSWSDGFLEALG